MNIQFKNITTADLLTKASNLSFEIDDYKHGDSAAWKCGYNVLSAERELEAIEKEIAEREQLEDQDRMDYLDKVDAANGR